MNQACRLQELWGGDHTSQQLQAAESLQGTLSTCVYLHLLLCQIDALCQGPPFIQCGIGLDCRDTQAISKFL